MENCAVTVTFVAEASSSTLDGFTVRPMAGGVSSSVSARLVPFTVRSAFVPDTVTVSLPSTSVSLVGVSVNVPVPLVLPAAMVTSKPVTAV